MKSYIQVTCTLLISLCVASKAADLSFDLSAPSQREIETFQKFYNIKQKDLAKSILEREIRFAKEYIKRYGLSQEDKSYLKILAIRYLSKQYIKKMLDSHLPNDTEAKAYYLLHKKRYKNQSFESVKDEIKHEMVQKKAVELIKKEDKRLQNEE